MGLRDLVSWGPWRVGDAIEVDAYVDKGDPVAWSGETGRDPTEVRFPTDDAVTYDTCRLYTGGYGSAGRKQLAVIVRGKPTLFHIDVDPAPPPPPPRHRRHRRSRRWAGRRRSRISR